MIIANKRHHIRLFPRDGDMNSGDRNGNPLPGTLVERDVTHPYEYDFYLNSHSAIQGTARPTHYYVILDEAKVPVDKLQKMIYQHCYQYIRSTTPVSLYPAIYYAHLASNRARSHEHESAEIGPRSGVQFEELNMMKERVRIWRILRGKKVEPIPEPGPIKELMDFGFLSTEERREAIRMSMWYI